MRAPPSVRGFGPSTAARRRGVSARALAGCGLALACTAGCGADDSNPAEPGPSTPPPASVVAVYGPSAETDLMPFPSNRYTRGDASTATGLRLDVRPETTRDQLATSYPVTADELNQLDGFSTTGGVILGFSGAIDPRGLVQLPNAEPPVLDPVLDATAYQAPGAPLYLANVDPESAEVGTLVGIIPTYWEQLADEFWIANEFTVIAQPAVPLRPRTRYALVGTRRLLASDGTPVGRTQEMHDVLEGRDSSAYAKELRAALAVLEPAAGLERDEVVVATTFTTGDVLSGVAALGEQRRAAPVPPLSQAWTIETPVQPDGRVRFVGGFPAPEFRKPKPDGQWELGPDGAPVVQSTVDLEVFLAFSDSTKGGKRPVVIYGHGLGGDKDGCWGTSERLAAIHASGAAVFAIDSPEHGSRVPPGGTTTLITSVYGFFGIDENDEFVIGRARDNFRQMASDQLELVRFVSSLATLDLLPLDASGQPAGDGEPDLDLSRILYIGHSFGSVQGPTVMALAPEIRHATWNVGGAGLMTLLRDSNTFRLVVEGLAPDGTPFGAIARFMAATQAIVDPGDPLNFARFATVEPLAGVPGWAARDVLVQEVVDDTIVPNSTTEAMARAAGLELLHEVRKVSGVPTVSGPVSGNLPGGATGVLAQFDRADGKKADHGGLIFTAEGRAQYVEFFRTALGGAHGTVADPY